MTDMMQYPVLLYADALLGSYHFGEQHPFGAFRYPAFMQEVERRGLLAQVELRPSQMASNDQLAAFHSEEHIAHVMRLSEQGYGSLDGGDTPALPGIHEAAAWVAGTVLAAGKALLNGEGAAAFVPIAGLHHARRDGAAGFCVYNDIGILLEYLLQQGLQRIAYVDIDAHHGDGVYDAYAADRRIIIADIHEDGHYLYPGTGHADACGKGEAVGSKLNLPLPLAANDGRFFEAWAEVELFVAAAEPEFIILQCGADSLAGDPLTHLHFSPAAHRHAAARLSTIAAQFCQGRLLALGGGGYNLRNIAHGWCAVLEAFIDPTLGSSVKVNSGSVE